MIIQSAECITELILNILGIQQFKYYFGPDLEIRIIYDYLVIWNAYALATIYVICLTCFEGHPGFFCVYFNILDIIDS